MSSQGPSSALLGPFDDDFDPAHDDWVTWLDDERVIEASRCHLDRCFQRDPARHDHP